MIGAIATATEMQNHFGKYLNMILNGNYDLEQERNSKLRKNMRLLIDVNILLDVLQKREPHFHGSSLWHTSLVWKRCETNSAEYLARI